MHDLSSNFSKFSDITKCVFKKCINQFDNFFEYQNKPKLFDCQIIALAVTGEVCRIVREKQSKICKESFETAPDKGFSAVNKSYYYGYKLHLVTSMKGIFHSMDLTKASVH